MNRNMYVKQLTDEQQEHIRSEVENYLYQNFLMVGLEREKNIEVAMNSKLKNLDHIIHFEEMGL